MNIWLFSFQLILVGFAAWHFCKAMRAQRQAIEQLEVAKRLRRDAVKAYEKALKIESEQLAMENSH